MLKPYRMLLVEQGSCSVLHNDALSFNRDKGRFKVSAASGSINSTIIDKGLVVFTVVCYDFGIPSLWRVCLCACKASW